jgi:hypothetical protein
MRYQILGSRKKAVFRFLKNLGNLIPGEINLSVFQMEMKIMSATSYSKFKKKEKDQMQLE